VNTNDTSTSPHDDILDDLPALLTGELSPARERDVAEHLDTCDPCRRELAVVARASAWLQDAVRLDIAPEMLTGDPLFDDVVLPPLKLPKHSWTPVRRSSSARTAPSRARWLAAAAGVVLLVVGVLGGVVVGRASDSGPAAQRTVAMQPVPGGLTVDGAAGKAHLAASGGLQLDVRGLPAAPGQDFYEVWLYDPPSGRMLAVGVLPSTGKGSYSLPATL
jgi:anti-sigma factor RsiW